MVKTDDLQALLEQLAAERAALHTTIAGVTLALEQPLTDATRPYVDHDQQTLTERDWHLHALEIALVGVIKAKETLDASGYPELKLPLMPDEIMEEVKQHAPSIPKGKVNPPEKAYAAYLQMPRESEKHESHKEKDRKKK